MVEIDFNSDLGESFSVYRLGCDDAILQHVTSANIACGFHAGDAQTIAATFARQIRDALTRAGVLVTAPSCSCSNR